jgi:hypothetical protein
MPAVHPLRHRLTREAQWWSLSKGWWITLFTIPVAGAVLLGIIALRPPLYHALVREDFLLEWAQFAAYLAAAGFAACTAYRLAHAKQRGLPYFSPSLPVAVRSRRGDLVGAASV